MMNRVLARYLCACALILAATVSVLAVQPDEVLDDPALEARARDLSAELRCMVCQNQSIDDSDAALARDLRVLVRQRLQEGDSDGEVLDYIVARYGEFVLLKPRFTLRNAALWGAPLLLLLAGGFFVFRAARAKAPSAGARLSEAEEKRLREVLGSDK